MVGTVVSATETAMSASGNGPLRVQADPVVKRLASIRQRLLEAGQTGRSIAEQDRDDDESEREWRAWTSSLPPIAFQIAHETKDLVMQVDALDNDQEDDDYS